jgi:nucleoside-diphosphate-sugar epimerase
VTGRTLAPGAVTLVTGASGFLGRAVASELMARGHAVRTFQRRASGVAGAQDARGSLTDPAAVARALDGVGQVVHLAAKVSLTGDPRDFARVNVDGTRSLVSAAREAGASRFVFVSSPSVAHTGSSIAGDDARPADPGGARGDYARSKARAELLSLAADAPGFAVVAVRPHLVWGPGDTQLVGRIVERAGAGRLPLLDGGRALIDTLYVDNAATGIAQALARADADGVHGASFVLTNGEPRPVAEILASVCLAAGVEPPTRSLPAPLARAAGSLIDSVWRIRPGLDEPPMTRFLAEQLSTSHWFDQRRTRRELGWVPAVTLDEGFARLAAWYSRSARGAV